MDFKTPDITPTDWKVTAGTIVTAVVALAGLDMTDAQKGAIVGALVALWGAFQVIGDTLRRRGRVPIATAQIEAASAAAVAAAPALAALKPEEVTPGVDLPADYLDDPGVAEDLDPDVETLDDGDDRATRELGGESVEGTRP